MHAQYPIAIYFLNISRRISSLSSAAPRGILFCDISISSIETEEKQYKKELKMNEAWDRITQISMHTQLPKHVEDYFVAK